MARDRRLPSALAAVHPRRQVPYRAELAIAAIVIALTAAVDLRGAIGFSSFGVLAYYLIANASAWTLPSRHLWRSRIVPVVGAVGCVTLALTVPSTSLIAGVIVLVVGIAVYWLQSRHRSPRNDRR
jgi:APA family basic amino acid/polyamine antiporter